MELLAHLLSSSSKNKKIPSKKILIFSYILEMELSSSNIKKKFMFSQKKALLIFWEMETPKKILIFEETEFCYISGN